MNLELAEINAMSREELEQEVLRLRNKYVWGLQVADIASCVFAKDIEESNADQFNSVSNEKLHEDLLEALSTTEDFAIYDWFEDVREAIPEFTTETKEMLLEKLDCLRAASIRLNADIDELEAELEEMGCAI